MPSLYYMSLKSLNRPYSLVYRFFFVCCGGAGGGGGGGDGREGRRGGLGEGKGRVVGFRYLSFCLS